MIIIAAMLLAGLVVIGLVFMLALRNWTIAEARTEVRLRSPDTPTVSYVVPTGQDPAKLMTALVREGFVSLDDVGGGTRRLLIECDEVDRTKVRRILEHVDRNGFDEVAKHSGRVRFDDETEVA
ncbi:MAG TPA: hypothetical protein VEX15_08755 [Nocardioidaceae bacterium]|nr:hypothetical protein [Nocardioidaceae bacterium]